MLLASPRRYSLATLRPTLAALLAAGGLALAVVPAASASAASNAAHLDRQVLNAMAQGQPVRVILVARGNLNTLAADLRRSGVKRTITVPIGHGIATELTADQVRHFSTDANVERIVFDAPVRLTDTPYDPAALATAYPAVVDAVGAWSNTLTPLTGQGIGIAV